MCSHILFIKGKEVHRTSGATTAQQALVEDAVGQIVGRQTC
eukprot:CAMPEP_0177358312 /NCGR_PEP_ID=MMETSP0368-20130122/35519_1 /TAXON_ID=447022 ORGANISM="Scrippsiella hangoei-like, Strain SHHI-4" /NCGR_SAMPLE_ID=MMETSP0368 /ASSEMBLY_ACC=CAM_ASM_000363 /LENGTH=40 /DNA_ID= /DNA_START= /DNA_END= /DNA_ORIENTATION=